MLPLKERIFPLEIVHELWANNSTNTTSLPKTNMFAPENQWLEDEFPFKMAYFQG